MHNALFDSLAYNWNKLNTGVSPSDSAVLYLLKVCKKNYNIQVSNDLQKSILKFSKPYITNKLKFNKTFYETRKEIITDKLGDDTLEFFFPTIDSLIYKTNLDYDTTTFIINELNKGIDNSDISESTKKYYKIFTSVFIHSLNHYYEIKNDTNQAFHKYSSLKASPGSWIVSDAIGALDGAIEGGTAGAAGGPVGVAVGATVGGVVVGALTSAVETSFSDLIDSWLTK